MLTGAFTRGRKETDFKRESSSKMATYWLQWEAERRKIHVRHQMNDTEKRIGDPNSFSVPWLLVAWP